MSESKSEYHNNEAKLLPSVLASDMSDLAEECRRVLRLGADYLHLDVMDGHFVPNLTFGAPIVKSLRKNLDNGDEIGHNAYFDVHLMVTNPEQWVTDMANAGANNFTFHIEATDNPTELINLIKENGMSVGIAIKPNTSVDSVFQYMDDIDLVLIMTVEPGFGGQSFMEDMMDKVKILRERWPNKNIEVDGGLSPNTIDKASQAGANWIVAGSSVYKAEDPGVSINVMKRSVEKYGNGKNDDELTSYP